MSRRGSSSSTPAARSTRPRRRTSQNKDAQLDKAHDEHKAQIDAKRPAAAVAPPDRATMIATVEARSAAELAELEDRFAHQKESLDEKLATRLAKLDDEHRLQDQRLAGRLSAASRSTASDIAKRKGQHDRQITDESRTLDAEVVKAEKPFAGQAEQAGQQAEADAWRQAEATGRDATARAAHIREKAKADAKAATDTGDAKARQAIAATDARDAHRGRRQRPAGAQVGRARRRDEARGQLTNQRGVRPSDGQGPNPQQQLDAAAADPNTPPETLAKLTVTRDKRQAEYDIMRNKVLHTDVAQKAALQRIDPARRDAFLYEAEQVSTPAQIEQLVRKYGRAD